MEQKLDETLINFEKNAIPLTIEIIDNIVKDTDFNFPESYLFIMKQFNGGEGEIGSDSWLTLFPFEDLKEINTAYSLLMSQIPNYYLIGKDAADTGYAFHRKDGTFHSFGLMSDFRTDFIQFLGNDFFEFLDWLEKYRY